MAETTRGKRVRAVREALGLQQEAFADLLNTQAAKYRLEVRYDNTRVSKIENGRQDVSVDDLLVVAALDPRKRGERWLGLGDAGLIAPFEEGGGEEHGGAAAQRRRRR